MRKLASIQRINSLSKIPDADNICMAHILGWNCVVGINDFVPGDLCVFFEVDAFLPMETRYEFLRGNSYRNNIYVGEGYRIRTLSIRGCISQGLALPINRFPEIVDPYEDIDEDMDVTELLNIGKWELPEVEGPMGVIIGDKPYGIPTTDETRIQSIPELIKEFSGKQYYISTKMDGTSCTMYFKDGKFGVCGKNNEYKDTDSCDMWKYAHLKDVDVRAKAFGRNIAIQGEFCGPGIHRNRLKLNRNELYVFNIFDLNTNKLLGLDDMKVICNVLGLNTVPIEEVKDSFNYTLEKIINLSRGKYPCGNDKEGIVVRTRFPDYNQLLGKSLSFKVLNNDFLKKDKG